MAAAWITRDKDGIVDAAYVAAYCSQVTLQDWRASGRKPELVDCGHDGSITVGAPLPDHFRIIDTY